VKAADRRLAELRARRAARAEDRAAFEERRKYGLAARHAAKLAHLAGRQQATQGKEEPEDPENRIPPETDPEAA
jgi:hypothetical protein